MVKLNGVILPYLCHGYAIKLGRLAKSVIQHTIEAKITPHYPLVCLAHHITNTIQ